MDIPSPTSDTALNRCPLCGGEVPLDPSDPAKDVACPHCGQLLWFVRKSSDGVVILTFLPGLMIGSESIERVDEVRLAIGDSSRVVLNLARLRFVSSMFLGMLTMLHKKLSEAHGQLKICGLHSDAMESFTTTRLDTLFDIHDDEASALAGF